MKRTSVYRSFARFFRSPGFTLIELMVVVAILSVIAAITLPIMLKMLSRAKQQHKVARKAVSQMSLKIRRLKRTGEGKSVTVGEVQAVASSQIGVHLNVDYILDGSKVVAVYQARFQGSYLLRNPRDEPLSTQVFFPFPGGAGTFSDLKFETRSPPTTRPVSSSPVSPSPSNRFETPRRGVRFTTRGVYWERTFAPDEELQIRIQYNVRGRDNYRYQIAPGKKRLFQFTMTVSGVAPRIPARSLQPTRHQRLVQQRGLVDQFRWDFRDFLTSENIELKFPLGYSKYRQFTLLGQLAGISLLFFAFAFWYFGEIKHPNSIDRINFLLLCLGFVSFYPLFIFLNDHIQTSWAFSIALGVSALLTTIHTMTFMGVRWAFLWSLPLQLFFTAGFTFAVLFPAYRSLAFTTGGVILVAFAVGINSRFQKERKEREKKRQQKEEQKQEQKEAREKKEAAEARLRAAEQERAAARLEAEAAEARARLREQGEQGEPSEQPPAEERFSETCVFCGGAVDPDFRHCHHCGKNLELTYRCPSCNKEYWQPSVQDFTYCRACGARLGSEKDESGSGEDWAALLPQKD